MEKNNREKRFCKTAGKFDYIKKFTRDKTTRNASRIVFVHATKIRTTRKIKLFDRGLKRQVGQGMEHISVGGFVFFRV